MLQKLKCRSLETVTSRIFTMLEPVTRASFHSSLLLSMAAYNKLTTWLRNVRSSLYTAKFRCFHETKQTQNEVERLLLQLGRICFRILLRQSENFSDFCKVLSQFAFRNMIVPFYTSSSARVLELPSISHTSFLTQKVFAKCSPYSQFVIAKSR